MEFEILWKYSNDNTDIVQYYYDSRDCNKLREFIRIHINKIEKNSNMDINNVWLLFNNLLIERVEKLLQKCINNNNIDRDK